MEEFNSTSVTCPTHNWEPTTRKVKRVTRTVEKYDAEGRFVGKEVITEEFEEYDKLVWEQPTYPYYPTYPQPPYAPSDPIVTWQGDTAGFEDAGNTLTMAVTGQVSSYVN